MTNEPAEPVIVNHVCPEHGQTLQAPATFRAVCGRCGRVRVPDENPA